MNEYTAEEIQQVLHLCAELLSANEELNTKIIAMDAWVKNGDARTRQLQNQIEELKYIIEIYEAKANN